jgi:two-component system, OmpR family, response regulator VicR
MVQYDKVYKKVRDRTTMSKPQKAQILIVEDETLLNEAYETVLKYEGYDVLKAFNGEEALNILENNTPDLILLDLRMPKMDGLTFLSELQKRNHPDYKIIVFSNYDVQKDIDSSFDLGATHYVLKAYASPKELVRIVRNSLIED